MSQPSAVEISLDLRAFADRPTATLAPLKELWGRVEPLLHGPALRAGEVRQVDPGNGRTVGVRVLAVPPGHAGVTADTAFAIYGVFEPPAVKSPHACTECRLPAPPRYGPFACVDCRAPLCDDHVGILDGRLTNRLGELLAFCPKHRPKDRDGRPATFWCAGHACRKMGRFGRAWADGRVPHPNAPATWYCPACYEDEFPPCGALGCKGTGSNRCEYVAPATGQPCGKRLCNLHVRRWQVFGPHRDGLRLCPDHSRTARLSAAEVVFQVTAATAVRSLLWHGRDSLPSLSYLRYTLQKATGRKFELADILALFLQVTLARPDLQQEVTDLRAKKLGHWKREIEEAGKRQDRGRELFEAVVDKYRELGFDEVADHLTFSDFSAPKRLLFVTLPEQYRGLFIGSGGANVKAVSAAVGLANINFEKLK